jgi:glycosyltransferase involved in cell wall biosynthesis
MISIITPVLNEEKYIISFLEHLKKIKGEFEIILVDGGSLDQTVNLIEKFSRKLVFKNLSVLISEPGRGVQINRGAKIANGDILLFLHVDCIIQVNSIKDIEKKIYSGEISIFGNQRVKLTNTFFGDYGIFIRKDIFEKVNGFDEISYLEDVEFCKKVKKYGNLKQIDCNIFTSARRYLSKGRLRVTLAFILASAFNIFGFRPNLLYKYIARV